jgi:acid phosphatase class B
MATSVDKLIQTYFKGWPKNTNAYVQDLIWAMKIGMQYLNKIKDKPSSKPKCVVFDFDDCLVFGDPAAIVGVREMEMGEHDGSEIFLLPRNEPIVKLAEYAKINKFQVVILTARPKESLEATKWNCRDFKIPLDAIIMNDGDKDPCFKVNTRRRIAIKYDIVLTIGDQITDVLCPGGKTAFIKLPDPGTYDDDKKTWSTLPSLASYAWIPVDI